MEKIIKATLVQLCQVMMFRKCFSRGSIRDPHPRSRPVPAQQEQLWPQAHPGQSSGQGGHPAAAKPGIEITITREGNWPKRGTHWGNWSKKHWENKAQGEGTKQPPPALCLPAAFPRSQWQLEELHAPHSAHLPQQRRGAAPRPPVVTAVGQPSPLPPLTPRPSAPSAPVHRFMLQLPLTGRHWGQLTPPSPTLPTPGTSESSWAFHKAPTHTPTCGFSPKTKRGPHMRQDRGTRYHWRDLFSITYQGSTHTPQLTLT